MAVCGWITVLRNSSPTIAQYEGITIGNTSLYVPVLTLIVVCGCCAIGIPELTPAVNALVIIVTNACDVAVVPVSAVIKERAGTAQSAQELTRLNSFLPATTDNADQIIAKLNGFKQYLNDYEKGTRIPTSKPSTPATPSTPNVFTNESDAEKAFSSGKLKVGDKITINGVTGTWR
jgi:hypothetical protein